MSYESRLSDDDLAWVIPSNQEHVYSCFLRASFEILENADNWCIQTFGEHTWFRVYQHYWFSSKSDYILFLLTWGDFK